jgi:hypothetical protein
MSQSDPEMFFWCHTALILWWKLYICNDTESGSVHALVADILVHLKRLKGVQTIFTDHAIVFRVDKCL